MKSTTNWKSTKLALTAAGMLTCAVTLIAGVIVLPACGLLPVSDLVALGLIAGLTGNAGVYTLTKWRQNVSGSFSNGYSDTPEDM